MAFSAYVCELLARDLEEAMHTPGVVSLNKRVEQLERAVAEARGTYGKPRG